MTVSTQPTKQIFWQWYNKRHNSYIPFTLHFGFNKKILTSLIKLIWRSHLNKYKQKANKRIAYKKDLDPILRFRNLQHFISCSWAKLSKRCFRALFSMLRIRFCWLRNSSSAETSVPSACGVMHMYPTISFQ